MESSFHVFSINPKQLDRFRDRHTTIGAKDDRLDAFVLANSVKTDRHCFRRVKINADELIELRSLSRLHDDLTKTRIRLANQLSAQLSRFAPHFLSLCSGADKPWFWALLTMVADPKDAAEIKKYKIAALIKAYKIKAHSIDEVWQIVKAPILRVVPGTITASLLCLKACIAQLIVVDDQQKLTDNQIKNLMQKLQVSMGKEGEHRDAEIILSLPGVGNIVAATILSESPQSIIERNYLAFRSQAGIAPVTRRSGKHLAVSMRYACNIRLRTALYHWGMASVQFDPISKEKYNKMRLRGLRHAQALRTLIDGLLRVHFKMLENGKIYNADCRQKMVA